MFANAALRQTNTTVGFCSLLDFDLLEGLKKTYKPTKIEMLCENERNIVYSGCN